MALGTIKLLGLHRDVKANAEWALAWADYYDVPAAVTSGFRSWQDQDRLRRNYEQCLAKGTAGQPGRCEFPANRPGDSAHNFGLAWDSWVPDWAMPWWAHVRELAGFRVPSGDIIHAEVPKWREIVRR